MPPSVPVYRLCFEAFCVRLLLLCLTAVSASGGQVVQGCILTWLKLWNLFEDNVATLVENVGKQNVKSAIPGGWLRPCWQKSCPTLSSLPCLWSTLPCFRSWTSLSQAPLPVWACRGLLQVLCFPFNGSEQPPMIQKKCTPLDICWAIYFVILCYLTI